MNIKADVIKLHELQSELDSFLKEMNQVYYEPISIPSAADSLNEHSELSSRLIAKLSGFHPEGKMSDFIRKSIADLSSLSDSLKLYLQTDLSINNGELPTHTLQNGNTGKNRSQITEEHSERIVSDLGLGYINGNKHPLAIRTIDEKKHLITSTGNKKGDQKPDKYRFDEQSGTIYIIEDKNYSIETKNGRNNLPNNMFKQLKYRMVLLGTAVSASFIGSTSNSIINKIYLTFNIDLSGHNGKEEKSPVLIADLNNMYHSFMRKATDYLKTNQLEDRVFIRIICMDRDKNGNPFTFKSFL